MRGKKRRPPKDRKCLYRKKCIWERQKRMAKSKERIEELNNKIINADKDIKKSLKKQQWENEQRTLNNIEENPKLFFSYAKKFRNTKTEIGPFKDGDTYTNDSEKICDMLLKQYNSAFSTKKKAEINDEIFDDSDENTLTDIPVNEKSIKEAIDELKNGSAPGPDGVPAVFLKRTREPIAKPLAILLRQSIDESSIAELHKIAYIAPQHKGGSRQLPKNYRPMSLTSHIIKIFERVIKKHIVEHLTSNNLINEGQHGFIPGKSTQTQLLTHFETIYQSLMGNERMDIVYLDFAKAFDKVNHKIVIQKLIKHKISGKIGRWIKEFLLNRKQIVIANGSKSKAADVLSGVPQGTVLAALLFVIMIFDIDKETQDAIVRSFADDTRVSKKIKISEDRDKLQSDLQIIYEWANRNNMEFNVEKFEQISHGIEGNVSIEPYKGPNGEDITRKNSIKDLGVTINNEIEFRDHIEKIVASSKVMSGYIFRTFNTRDRKPLEMLYKTYIRSKLEYCNMVWSPNKQQEIAAIESVQRSYTAKIKDVEELDYWDRLKELKMYSLERRRERYMIIYAWQQLEGIRENIMKLKASERGRGRLIISPTIPWKVTKKNRTLIHNSPARKMERVFNKMPGKIRNIRNVTTDTFKKSLDKFLCTIPDQPRVNDAKYISRALGPTNSIVDQVNNIAVTAGATR